MSDQGRLLVTKTTPVAAAVVEALKIKAEDKCRRHEQQWRRHSHSHRFQSYLFPSPPPSTSLPPTQEDPLPDFMRNLGYTSWAEACSSLEWLSEADQAEEGDHCG